MHTQAAAYRTRVASIFSVFTRPGRLPAPLRAQLEPEGIIHVAERLRVRQQFSGSIPGMTMSWIRPRTSSPLPTLKSASVAVNVVFGKRLRA